jgi:hypothetical protein
MEAASDSSNNKYFTTDNLLNLSKIFIGLSTLCYVAGYMVWGRFAYQNALGFLPALQNQYIMAGIIPVLIFLFFGGLTPFAYDCIIKIALSTCSKRTKWIFLFIIPIFIHFYIYTNKGNLHHLTFLIAIFSVFSILIIIFYKCNLFKKFQRVIINSIIVLTLIGGVPGWTVFYIDNWFQRVPPEFGGPEAICCVLDIDSKQLSQQTVYDLCGKMDSLSENGLYRTKPVYLIFDSEDYLLLSKPDSTSGGTNPIIKIKASCVPSLMPCAIP